VDWSKRLKYDTLTLKLKNLKTVTKHEGEQGERQGAVRPQLQGRKKNEKQLLGKLGRVKPGDASTTGLQQKIKSRVLTKGRVINRTEKTAGWERTKVAYPGRDQFVKGHRVEGPQV